MHAEAESGVDLDTSDVRTELSHDTIIEKKTMRSRRAFLGGLAATAALAGCRSTPMSVEELGLSSFSASAAHHYPIHGIDVAKYQGDIDWHAARRAETAFAFLKATEGGDRLDDRFHQNWRGAAKAGVPRGAYHFWYHCRPGHEQAKWFIENVPRQRGALPPVIDVEWTPFSPTCTIRPPREELVREVGEMAEALERHYGQRPLFYIPIDVHRDRFVGAFPNHEFWLRAVADHPDNVYENRKFRFWQYTATGSVDGIEGEVDRNAFAGTHGDWAKWLKAHTRA
ncbi:glycoside hydrolase family 25 protein [Jiella marina]|uniref:glycoside hydrolase family 25 protein n=1 Tax=Jiella sp. LLJ827 TaxID=2917712 RepID=UPI002101B818|nr:glycoside hydrolase family 25 protein [Jiella sp. LLJ827]MCQ0989994.1 glycoside hydrolase family 25 protein [Jiella sp. LLJ827]